MRTNLEDNLARRMRHLSPQFEAVRFALTGSFVIPTDGAMMQFLDAGLANRTVFLPVKAAAGGQLYIIANIGAANDLNVVDDLGVAVGTVRVTEMGLFVSYAGGWRFLVAPPETAPTDAEFITASANAILSAERLLTDTATVAWDFATAAQAKAGIVDNSVTYAKFQQVAASSLVGNFSGALANAGAVTIGSSLVFNGADAGALERSALTGGDVTSPLNSNVLTLVNIPSGTPMAGSLLATVIAAPGVPAAGKASVYVDSTNKNLASKADTGQVYITVGPSSGAANQFATGISSAGVISYAQPTQANISGLGTGDSPQFTAVNIGHASDTTLTRVSAGVAAIEGSNILLASGIGSIVQGFDTTLNALAAFTTNGLMTQTAGDTFTGRTLTGTAAEITVTNGNGVSGNPTVSLPAALTLTGKTITGGTFVAPVFSDASISVNSVAVFPGLFSRVSTQFDKTSDTTLANVTGLSATVAAAGVYCIRAVLFTSANIAGGVKSAISGTATATSFAASIMTFDLTGSANKQDFVTALGSSSGITTATAAKIVIDGTIVVNAGGTITVQFAQNASNAAASSVLVGSYLDLQRHS